MRKTLPSEIMLAVGDRSFSADRAEDLVYYTGLVLEYDNINDTALRSALVVLAARCVQWIQAIDSNGLEAA